MERKENTTKDSILCGAAVFAIFAIILMIPGCGTVSGFAQDLQAASEGIAQRVERGSE